MFEAVGAATRNLWNLTLNVKEVQLRRLYAKCVIDGITRVLRQVRSGQVRSSEIC